MHANIFLIFQLTMILPLTCIAQRQDKVIDGDNDIINLQWPTSEDISCLGDCEFLHKICPQTRTLSEPYEPFFQRFQIPINFDQIIDDDDDDDGALCDV